MSEPGIVANVLGQLAYEFTLVQPFLPTYAHLLVSALFPIYAGAHASLSRPTSAAEPKKDRKTKDKLEDDEFSDEEEEETQKMEGLSPSDAVIMPLLAGCTLAGLYVLIKWLGDAILLNKILNAYFAIFGVFSVGRLVTDALDIGHSIIFPRRHVLDGALYHVHGKEKKARPVAGNIRDKQALDTPFPGFLARIPLSASFREYLWSDRAMPGNKWTLRIYLHRIFAGKVLIGPHGIFGFAFALCAVSYFNLVDKPWYLTNLMGFGFSYGALQLMSPTTFATGSLILGALFFYDIYFVFFTPMMVTVAKSLDVPIKLVFPRPPPADSPPGFKSLAMLGLGDVVLPGIMIGLALRFDLFVFYLRKQKRVPALDQTEGREQVEKAKYFSLAGRWSDHFWTHSLSGRPLYQATSAGKLEAPFTFPKTYFKASLVGYVLGMLMTLGVMHVWGHAQPALLYLVPGVLGSLWLTALVRGELGMMWEFSEAAEEEEEGEDTPATEDSEKDKNKTKGPAERTSFFSMSDKKSKEREDRLENAIKRHVSLDHDEDEGEDETSGTKDKVKEVARHRAEREVFSFSIEAPWTLKHPRSVRRGSKGSIKIKDGVLTKETDGQDAPVWAPPDGESTSTEQPVKRVRLG